MMESEKAMLEKNLSILLNGSKATEIRN